MVELPGLKKVHRMVVIYRPVPQRRFGEHGGRNRNDHGHAQESVDKWQRRKLYAFQHTRALKPHAKARQTGALATKEDRPAACDERGAKPGKWALRKKAKNAYQHAERRQK